ncbi:transmembrane protein, putative (macronuclear) [Tetrahymena thermophila SB210]|uniref:Transmembrane protein, putative n=1 Tax=Tetrahymena thermophila (strain SB210) TaxID=312017 RepID=W7X8A4_TETTS|nr:transmembrane protein, putative [Tetrahymena thermophila SB210]EWS75605.1 transmembrane protein, putative [Tetrahymena thermophila SB210]|eukprot:XP_012651858.1 transmembrane protein, putative [Tetrahymena thermophila SB210]
MKLKSIDFQYIRQNQLNFHIRQLFNILEKNKQMIQKEQHFYNLERFKNSSLKSHQVLHIDLSGDKKIDDDNNNIVTQKYIIRFYEFVHTFKQIFGKTKNKNTKIDNEGASVLSTALAKCTNLSNLTLNLESNQIGDKGISDLGYGLANCINLSNLTINLFKNNVGAVGASGLGSDLGKCSNLSNLTLNLSIRTYKQPYIINNLFNNKFFHLYLMIISHLYYLQYMQFQQYFNQSSDYHLFYDATLIFQFLNQL